MNQNNNLQRNNSTLPESPKLDPETDKTVKDAVKRTIQEYGEVLEKMGNE